MVVQHSVQIGVPIEVCSASLVRGLKGWLPHLGEQANYTVGAKNAGVPGRDEVRVEAGQPERLGAFVEVPITWESTNVQNLIPLMIGKVDLAPIDARVTRLSVCGEYEPLLGLLGEHHALMHEVAEATVRELAEAIAARLEGLGYVPGVVV
jgi:hypothetical protein